MRTDLPFNSQASLRMLFLRVFVPAAFLAAALICAQVMAAAQAQATAAPSGMAHKLIHKHKRRVAAHAQRPAPQSAAAPATPSAPELPHWPANEKPVPPSVTWDSHGLRIAATNSSLAQILEDVATATGTKVDGFYADERIFGVYGPGPARDVLGQLLHGTGYNVILIGDLGQGTPRQVVLSARSAGNAASAANAAPPNASDEDVDTEEQPQQAPPIIRPSFAPGEPPRTPQQITQQREWEMQHGQQQQPDDPPN